MGSLIQPGLTGVCFPNSAPNWKHDQKLKTVGSSILAWRLPWTEEPDRLQSMGWQKARHNTASEHTHTHMYTGKAATV